MKYICKLIASLHQTCPVIIAMVASTVMCIHFISSRRNVHNY